MKVLDAVGIAVGAVLALAACDRSLAPPGEHPALQALVEDCESPRFDLSFWQGEASRDTVLWGLAASFCAEHAEAALPNCRLVRAVASAGRQVFFDLSEDQLVAPAFLFRQPSYGEVSP